MPVGLVYVRPDDAVAASAFRVSRPGQHRGWRLGESRRQCGCENRHIGVGSPGMSDHSDAHAGAHTGSASTTATSVPAPSLDDLADRLGEAQLLTDPDLLQGYRQDWAKAPNPGMPLAVVRARSTEDVQEVMRWASAHGVPVVPRGAGSGLSGGATEIGRAHV